MAMNLGRPIILYMHAGSGNHGCEAIVDSTLKIIEKIRREQRRGLIPSKFCVIFCMYYQL